MNTLSIDCSCGKRLSVRKDLAGKRVRCPSCSAVLTVQAPTPPQSGEVICGCGQPLSVPANKVVAFLLLIPSVLLIGSFVVGFVGGAMRVLEER